MGKLFHRSRWNNRKVVTGTIMLFLWFVIAGYIEGDSFGQDRFGSVPGNLVQAPVQTSSEAGAKTAVSNLIKTIRSKDLFGLGQVTKEIESTKAFNWAIPALKEILRDEDADIKFMGLLAIGKIWLTKDQKVNRSPELKSLLLEIVALIRDKDAVVRYQAVEILDGTDTLRNDESAAKRAIPALIEYLQYQVEEKDIPHTLPRGIIRLGGQWDDFRQEAASALAKIGPRAVPALMEALNNDNALIREGAVRALGEIGPQAKQAVPLLLAAKGDNDNRIRFRAAVALWKVDRQAKPAIPILIEFVQTPDVSVGMVAAQTLGEMGSQAKEAVLVLAEIMKKDWHIVSSSCARALGKIGPEAKAAVPALLEVLKGEDEPPPKLPESIHDRVPPSRPEYLKPKYHNLRFEAAEALWRIDRQYKVVVPILIQILKEHDGYDYEGSRAADLLGEIGPDAIEAVPELLKAAKAPEIYKGEEPPVRDAAIKALKKIDPKVKGN